MNQINKIIVIGCSGSGKSIFSTRLANILQLPLYHLDNIYWKPNWVPTPRNEFITIQHKIMSEGKWIIDGNYSSTLEIRFLQADVVFFLDLPIEVCLESALKRIGTKRNDLPSYLDEIEDPTFIEHINNFNNNGKLKIQSMFNKYPNKKIITFTSRDEVNEYLLLLKKMTQ